MFMLGKLMWCIFEGQPFVRCGVDHEILRDVDPDYETERTGKARAFPEFKKTPSKVRRLIRACTAGAPEWEASKAEQRTQGVVVLRRGKLYPAAPGAGSSDTTNPDDTAEAARRFWQREVEQAKAFMLELRLHARGEGAQIDKGSASGPPSGSLLGQVRMRPTLSEVLAELARIEEDANT